MTPLTVFVRTLVRSSALFLGVTIVFLHPTLDWTTAGEAARAQQGPTVSAVDGLAGVLTDSDAGVRLQAAAALGAIGSPRAVAALARALTDANPNVRARSATALGEIGDRAALDALAAARKDEDPTVRRCVVEAIALITRVRLPPLQPDAPGMMGR
ncbi:MAG TPA: HEAT repeat domain-containing protein [Vicinamibacterales bacterium]|nr:HEAT repeat domain-containing protein [Vicinamibacterales bacterium]